MHGKISIVQHDGRGVFAGVSQPFDAGRYHSLVIAEPAARRRSRSARATDDGVDHGDAARDVAGARRAVPSRVGADAARARRSCGTSWSCAMFRDAAREAAAAHEDLTADEAAGRDGRDHGRRARSRRRSPACSMALALKGERPAEIVGLARTMRARAPPLSRVVRAGVRHVRHRRRRRAHVQRVDGGGARAGGVRRARRQARQSRASRAGAAAPTCFEALGVNVDGAAAASSSAAWTQAGIAFFFAPAWHPSMRHAGPTRRELGVRTAFNLLGPLTNPAGARAAAGRRVAAGAHRAGGALARRSSAPSAPGSCTAPTASTRSRRPATRRCRSAATARVNTFYVHPADVGPAARRAGGDLRGGDAAENAAIARAPARRRARGRARHRAAERRRGAADRRPRGDACARASRVAAEAIDSGRARAALRQLVACRGGACGA